MIAQAIPQNQDPQAPFQTSFMPTDPLRSWLSEKAITDPMAAQILNQLDDLRMLNQRMYASIIEYAAPDWVVETCKQDPQGKGSEYFNSFLGQRGSIYNESLRYKMPNYGGFLHDATPPPPPASAQQQDDIIELRT